MILGVDPGLANVGWCLLTTAGVIDSFGHIETKKSGQPGDAAHRLAMVMFGLSKPLLAMASAEDGDHGTVVIEWPGGAGGFQREGAASANARAAIQTSTTAGAVYGSAYWLLRGHTERILTPAPVTWRSAMARHLDCQRDEGAVHFYLTSLHPGLKGLAKKAAPHVLDAAGLAEYGRLITQEGRTT